MKINRVLYSFVAVIALLLGMAACSPDSYSLGDKNLTSDDLREGVAFDIVPDASNPNIINLVSKLPSNYQVLWEHPQGRDRKPNVTLNIPFDGDYTVKMGVETRGGVVYGPEATFHVAQFCADFVEDELWTFISGGVGNHKKWYVDLDKNGVSRYFNGPLYYKGTDDCWESVTLGQTIDGDSWSWDAGYSGISGWQWGGTPMDYGYMEFDLDGGSNVHVVMNDLGRDMTGKYMLDVDNHTISFTDAELLHESVNDGQVEAWSGTLKLLSLTENTMQIGVIRTGDPCILCINFISEDYFNNWTPEVVDESDVTPELPADWRDYVEPKTQKQMTLKLAADDTPFDWMNLDGSNRGIKMDAADGIEDLTLELNRNDNSYKCSAPDGTTVEGTYELSNDGIYTFSNGLPEVQLSANGLSVFKANADKTLRILSIELDDYTGALGNIWLGSEEKDDQGNLYQYAGYHFIPFVAGGGDAKRYTANINFFDTGWSFINGENVFITGDGDYTFTITGSSDSPYGIYLDVLKILADYPNMDMSIKDIKVDGKSIEFDDALIDRGVGDAPTTARRYILNPWGDTAGDAPKYVFSSSIEVTLHVVLDNGEPYIK